MNLTSNGVVYAVDTEASLKALLAATTPVQVAAVLRTLPQVPAQAQGTA